MYEGSCLCGAISFRLLSKPRAVTNCHCRMCQKQHGAVFATYASVPRSDMKYLSGQELLTGYNSSGRVVRKFCSVCGSNIEWGGSQEFSGWVSIPLSILDTPFTPKSVKDIHLESRMQLPSLHRPEKFGRPG